MWMQSSPREAITAREGRSGDPHGTGPSSHRPGETATRLRGRRKSECVLRVTTGPDSRYLVGVCGLYCGACYHYRASFPEGGHLLEEALLQGRAAQGYACRGCRSDALYVHPGCSQCEIRACADSRRIRHCGTCREFPCGRLEAFQSDGRVHHRAVISNLEELRACGVEEWLAEQQRRWQCDCGAQFSWYEERCWRCGASLTGYGRDSGDR